MTEQQLDSFVRHLRSWPKVDQDELVEIARDIEARRSGVYRATAEELLALDEADQSGVAGREEVDAAFAAFRTERKLSFCVAPLPISNV
jgi:hypothetical protein